MRVGAILILGIAALCPQACYSLSCLKEAAASTPTEEWLRLLKHHSRELPDIQGPHFSYSDWPGVGGVQDGTSQTRKGAAKVASPPDWSKARPELARYKVHNGVLYADHDHAVKTVVTSQRDAFVEMVFSALWLYKEFPDVEFFVNFDDVPVAFSQEIPFLQYAAIAGVRRSNLAGPLAQAATEGDPVAGLHADDRLNFDVDPMHLVMRYFGNKDMRPLPWTRGFVIPYPDDWRDLALSPEQLRLYSLCIATRVEAQKKGGSRASIQSSAQTALQARHYADSKADLSQDAWAAARIPKAIWRGSATGFGRGWSPLVASDSEKLRSFTARVSLNKRVFMAAMSRPYPWLDVGITRVHTWAYPYYRIDRAGNHTLKMVQKPRMAFEDWSKYIVTLSVDGHGAPWRLARQMLGMTPVLKSESPLQAWFAPFLRRGVHYEPMAHDLHDLPVRAKQLIEEAQQNSTRLQRMAQAAAELVVDKVNLLAQLDSFMWALLKVKEICTWPLEPPLASFSLNGSCHMSSNRTHGAIYSGARRPMMRGGGQQGLLGGSQRKDTSGNQAKVAQLPRKALLSWRADSVHESSPVWQVVRLPKSRSWRSKGMKPFKQAVMNFFPDSFCD